MSAVVSAQQTPEPRVFPRHPATIIEGLGKRAGLSRYDRESLRLEVMLWAAEEIAETVAIFEEPAEPDPTPHNSFVGNEEPPGGYWEEMRARDEELAEDPNALEPITEESVADHKQTARRGY